MWTRFEKIVLMNAQKTTTIQSCDDADGSATSTLITQWGKYGNNKICIVSVKFYFERRVARKDCINFNVIVVILALFLCPIDPSISSSGNLIFCCQNKNSSCTLNFFFSHNFLFRNVAFRWSEVKKETIFVLQNGWFQSMHHLTHDVRMPIYCIHAVKSQICVQFKMNHRVFSNSVWTSNAKIGISFSHFCGFSFRYRIILDQNWKFTFFPLCFQLAC